MKSEKSPSHEVNNGVDVLALRHWIQHIEPVVNSILLLGTESQKAAAFEVIDLLNGLKKLESPSAGQVSSARSLLKKTGIDSSYLMVF